MQHNNTTYEYTYQQLARIKICKKLILAILIYCIISREIFLNVLYPNFDVSRGTSFNNVKITKNKLYFQKFNFVTFSFLHYFPGNNYINYLIA